MTEPTDDELHAAWVAEQIAKAHPLDDAERRQLVAIFEHVEIDESGAA